MNANNNMNQNSNTDLNNNINKRQVKKIYWGILFLLGAAALLLGRLGYLDGINFWSVLISIALFGFLAKIFRADPVCTGSFDHCQ